MNIDRYKIDLERLYGRHLTDEEMVEKAIQFAVSYGESLKFLQKQIDRFEKENSSLRSAIDSIRDLADSCD